MEIRCFPRLSDTFRKKVDEQKRIFNEKERGSILFPSPLFLVFLRIQTIIYRNNIDCEYTSI